MIPDGFVAYKETRIFDETSVPAGLLADHATRAGVWARVEVLSGRLDLKWSNDGSIDAVSAEVPGIIPPERRHAVVLDGPVRFKVVFHRARSDHDEQVHTDPGVTST